MINRFLIIMVTVSLSICEMACSKTEDGFLKVDKSKCEQVFDSNGGIVQIPVNTNKSFSVTVESGKDWIHCDIVGMSVKLATDSMNGGPDRTGSVVIAVQGCQSAIVTVYQYAISVNNLPETIALNNSLLSFSIQITAGCEIGFEKPNWISGIDTTWVAGTKTYTFQASMFLDAEKDSRSGTLTILSRNPSVSWAKSVRIVQSSYSNEAVQTIAALWKTSPIGFSTERYNLLAKIEGYSNLFDRDQFQTYLKASDSVADQTEKDNPIMSIYRYAFDNALEQIKSAVVEEGTVQVWMIYNMGFVFKTPTACFGMDINHRYASKLEPYLDFICVSHSDLDHVDTPLMAAMNNHGKPVLSNFYTASGAYCSKTSTTYTIKDLTIRTCLTDENETDLNCTTCFRINCGARSGGFELMHVGDSSFDPAQYIPVEGGNPDLLILRYGSTAEKNILGTGTGQVDPDYIFFSHQIELRHYISKSPMRASILGSIGNRSNLGTYSTKVSLPFWGTHLTWKDGKFE